jgi:hypothetical protein
MYEEKRKYLVIYGEMGSKLQWFSQLDGIHQEKDAK